MGRLLKNKKIKKQKKMKHQFNIVYCNLRQMKIQSFLFKYLKEKKLYSMFFHLLGKLILLDKIFSLKIFKGKGLYLHLVQIAVKNIEKLKIQIFANF